MILINLLPHREAKRRQRKQAFFAACGLAAVVGLLLSSVVFIVLQAELSARTAANTQLKTEIEVLDRQIKQITTLEQDIAALLARKRAVEDLQLNRNLPVHLLNDLALQLPEGAYLESLRQDGDVVNIKGMAQSFSQVSDLLRNLSSRSQWLDRPDLVESTQVSVAVSPQEQKRLQRFEIKVNLKREAAAQAASGAVPRVAPASGPAQGK
ncbi:MAG: fimbrial protein [Burkholderiaceae bacterium]|nr:MAG: fimbrial protein [Burkholderiaceae bacterium]